MPDIPGNVGNRGKSPNRTAGAAQPDKLGKTGHVGYRVHVSRVRHTLHIWHVRKKQ